MDATLKDVERRTKEQRSQQSSGSEKLDINFGRRALSERQDLPAGVSGHDLGCSNHLPFHGNPLDRSGTKEWARKHLPAVLKASTLTEFLPVTGRSVYGLKQVDKRNRSEARGFFCVAWGTLAVH